MTYYHPVLDFIAAHPWLSFFFIWPVGLILVSLSWCLTSMIAMTMGNLMQMIQSVFLFGVTLVRGYPPEHITNLRRAFPLDNDGNDSDPDGDSPEDTRRGQG